MVIVIECVNCVQDMGISPSYVTSQGDVRQRFVCPYCEYEYTTVFHFKVKGLQDGVNIKGNTTVHGDVTGGNKTVINR